MNPHNTGSVTTTADVTCWQRCEELAKGLNITIKLSSGFELHAKNGVMLGKVDTVRDVFMYLCGFDSGAASERGKALAKPRKKSE